MNIKGSVALVTGANRGLGRAFARALLAAGAQKVYAGARDLATITDPDLHPLKLDITNPNDVARAAEVCQDVNILINNAGVMHCSPVLSAPSMDAARSEMETNYFGTLAMCRAFAPILKRNGGGALVNMLSVVSWFTPPLNGSYSVSKAAELAMTNGIRVELRAQGTLVIGVHAGFIDTDMAASITVPKTRPEDVAVQTMAAIEAGREEVLADEYTRKIKARLATDPQSIAREMQKIWDERPSQ